MFIYALLSPSRFSFGDSGEHKGSKFAVCSARLSEHGNDDLGHSGTLSLPKLKRFSMTNVSSLVLLRVACKSSNDFAAAV